MNPLRIDDKPGEDTRYYVRSVLSFMANAFVALEDSEAGINAHSMIGAAWIMQTCIKALEEPGKEEAEE